MQFHPLSEATRRELAHGGLDSDAVAALVRLAVAEDLAGGIDVTSVATVPARQRSVGQFGARRSGVLAGPRKFARDVRGELRRVTWPDRDQLRQSTAVVLIIVIVLAVYVAAVDFVFQNLVRLIFL